jgi:3-deoxy-D-manno-octulosonic-acid transferase
VAWGAVTTLAVPVLRVVLRRRAARGKEIAGRLPEREGREVTLRPACGRLLWLHAASVGEAVSLLPVLAALPPHVFILFTTGTVTSARLLEARLPALGLADRVTHRFAPLDVPQWVARFLDHWRPDAACFAESELWPNTLAACAARGIPLALLNARMSVASATWWCNLPGFAAETLARFAFIAAQSAADAGRLQSLGARAVESHGNLKYAAQDLPADDAEVERLRALLAGRPAWLAASTHPGEEDLAAGIHRALAPRFPGLVTGIVPRHPERGATIAAGLGGAGRRSLGADPDGLWIADTLGELGLMFRLFPIVFMGKSFSGPGFGAGGGQNPLEPARFGCAIATGPATGNFADPVATMRQAGGLEIVADSNALRDWVACMLTDAAARTAMGEAARRVARAESDLPSVLARRIVDLLEARA